MALLRSNTIVRVRNIKTQTTVMYQNNSNGEHQLYRMFLTFNARSRGKKSGRAT
ncbi:hypothetical protein EDD18DRAFT_1332964 [Armillaria luteobubalina]|uniref:Uncharacterized protein n=1 Tax=Armillaria luteobubalina TaxID=153913 RepID=A0AA39Q3R8_9AGAR|nr:hypothetical protein EDD18DRAFT_1332964 [Armillaria luteobubalina]